MLHLGLVYACILIELFLLLDHLYRKRSATSSGGGRGGNAI
jgi:hypothetical protein